MLSGRVCGVLRWGKIWREVLEVRQGYVLGSLCVVTFWFFSLVPAAQYGFETARNGRLRRRVYKMLPAGHT